jgi:hypothetical protein
MKGTDIFRMSRKNSSSRKEFFPAWFIWAKMRLFSFQIQWNEYTILGNDIPVKVDSNMAPITRKWIRNIAIVRLLGLSV